MVPALELAPGQVFANRFRVVRLLARGGMGAVYVVEQLSTQKLRALKLMLPLLNLAERRFEQEARASSLIDSEHVVEVIDVGVDTESLAPWLAMELLEGELLSAYLDRQGPLDPADTHEILRQLCHGLIAAHDLGVVHRDLKPDNVFLAASRTGLSSKLVKILDFGLAKVLERDSRNTTAMGTPLWMAPEQSDPEQEISCATDVWAIGLIAYRMLVGRDYWLSVEAGLSAFFRELLVEPLQSASSRCRAQDGPELPDGFDAWFARCVARVPEDRYQHAREAWDDLTSVLSRSAHHRNASQPNGPSATHERTLVSAPPPPLDTPVASASSADEHTVLDGAAAHRRESHRKLWRAAGVAVIGLLGALALWQTLASEGAAPPTESGAASVSAETRDQAPSLESAPPVQSPPDPSPPVGAAPKDDSAPEAAGTSPKTRPAPSPPPRDADRAPSRPAPTSGRSSPQPSEPSSKPPAPSGLPDLL